MGRRTKCTKQLRAEICKGLRRGHSIAVVCGYVGIDESTFHRWMAKGRKSGLLPYREFYEEVTAAQAKAMAEVEDSWWQRATQDAVDERTHVEIIKDPSGNVVKEVTRVTKRHKLRDWRAGKAFAGQRMPKLWGKRPIAPDEDEAGAERPGDGEGPPRKIEVVFAVPPVWEDGKLVQNQEGPVEDGE